MASNKVKVTFKIMKNDKKNNKKDLLTTSQTSLSFDFRKFQPGSGDWSGGLRRGLE